MRPPRRETTIAVTSMVVAVALFVGVPTAVGASYQLAHHASCVAGSPTATGTFWTPVAVVDSPPTFNNSTTYAITTAWAPGITPVYLNLSGGEAGGIFSLDDWALVPQSLRWAAGPGSVPTCPALVAEDLSRLDPSGSPSTGNFTELLPPGDTSDISVPDAFVMAGPGGVDYASVEFFANYTDGLGNVSFRALTVDYIIGAGTLSTTVSSVGATFLVVVPFTGPGGKLEPYATMLGGVVSSEYYIVGPWDGCIEWAGAYSNPFGTGLSFGPAPAGPGFCAFP